MKKDIHPTYYPTAQVICACGNSFVAGSVMPEIKTELCSACHPFYTGKQKLIDSARRVEKFGLKAEKKATTVVKKSDKMAAKAEKKAAKKVTKA